MSTSLRNLARLPLEIYEQLVELPPHRDHHHTSLENFSEEEPSVASGPTNNIAWKPAAELRREILSKLQAKLSSSDGVVTVGALQGVQSMTLLRMLDPLLTYEQCQEFYGRVLRHCAPTPKTALDLLNETRALGTQQQPTPLNEMNGSLPRQEVILRYLPTGLDSLDKCLRGGLRVGSLTEVVGPAGVGKSQFAMQLIIMSAAFQQGAIFIDTEKKFSLSRLREMAFYRYRNVAQHQHQHTDYESNPDDIFLYRSEEPISSSPLEEAEGRSLQEGNIAFPNPDRVLDNVHIHSPTSTEDLMAVLTHLDEEIFVRNQASASSPSLYFPVRILVVDSIAAPARRDFGSGSAPQRAAAVLQCAQTLKRLADAFQLVVLVINQVGSVGRTDEEPPSSSGASTQAALGTAWHHCVSTRLLFQYFRYPTEYIGPESTDGRAHDPHDRQISIAKSNAVPAGLAVVFSVKAEGLVTLGDP